MNHPLTTLQQQQKHTELSRVYHLLLERCDYEMRMLESQMTTLPIAEFNARKLAIEDIRKVLRAEWEKANDNS